MGTLDAEILALARRAVEHYVSTGKLLPAPSHLSGPLGVAGPVFVSLRVGGALRGCIGTLVPTRPTVAEEIIANAAAAAAQDPRFPPVTAAELPALDYEVDLVQALTPVAGADDLDPERYGVVVESGRRRGVLLPAIAGISSIPQQIGIARLKAGIAPDEAVTLYRFSVVRCQEQR